MDGFDITTYGKVESQRVIIPSENVEKLQARYRQELTKIFTNTLVPFVKELPGYEDQFCTIFLYCDYLGIVTSLNFVTIDGYETCTEDPVFTEQQFVELVRAMYIISCISRLKSGGIVLLDLDINVQKYRLCKMLGDTIYLKSQNDIVSFCASKKIYTTIYREDGIITVSGDPYIRPGFSCDPEQSPLPEIIMV